MYFNPGAAPTPPYFARPAFGGVAGPPGCSPGSMPLSAQGTLPGMRNMPPMVPMGQTVSPGHILGEARAAQQTAERMGQPQQQQVLSHICMISHMGEIALTEILLGLQLTRKDLKSMQEHNVTLMSTQSPPSYLVRLNMTSTQEVYVGAQVAKIDGEDVHLGGIDRPVLGSASGMSPSTTGGLRTRMQYVSNRPFVQSEIIDLARRAIVAEEIAQPVLLPQHCLVLWQ